jgi:hypothetical protein
MERKRRDTTGFKYDSISILVVEITPLATTCEIKGKGKARL